MKHLMKVLILACSINNLHSMGYVITPFKYIYNGGCFMLGNETILDKNIDSFLKTLSASHCTTKEELRSFVTKNTEKYINDRISASPAFLVYIATLFLYDSKLEEKFIKKIDLFTKEQANTLESKKPKIYEEYTDDSDIDWIIIDTPTGSTKK